MDELWNFVFFSPLDWKFSEIKRLYLWYRRVILSRQASTLLSINMTLCYLPATWVCNVDAPILVQDFQDLGSVTHLGYLD